MKRRFFLKSSAATGATAAIADPTKADSHGYGQVPYGDDYGSPTEDGGDPITLTAAAGDSDAAMGSLVIEAPVTLTATAVDPDVAIGALRIETAEDPDPTVDRMEIIDDRRGNSPHDRFIVEWEVSVPEPGELDLVALTVNDANTGETHDARMYDASGQHMTGSDEFEIKHGNGGTYQIAIRVETAAGKSASETATRSFS